uniref:DNA damage induced apoptosis suppressor n=1 Tax=Sphenodon punctatus TaxID=8508 RepID=A0A8D0GKP6_SPHPU
MNGRRLFAASVISIQNSSFVYPSCQNCFSRLTLDSQRFNCLKCGCTGEAKDPGYRYRLSLEVADTKDLFCITVFGSCLDAYFGLSAGCLQRYIQDFNQESGEPDRNTSPSVLIQAVETCFIGRQFIFGVKDSGSKTHTRNLTACQIFLPNIGVSSLTVISCLHRLLQPDDFRGCRSSSQLPDSLLIAIDQPSCELSSLLGPGSGSSGFVQSSGRDRFSRPWLQSFGLTSSSVDCVTDFSALEPREATNPCTQEKKCSSTQPCALEYSYRASQHTQGHNHVVSKRDDQEDNVFNQPTIKLESYSSERELSPGKTSSRFLQSPLELGGKYSPKIAIRCGCCPEKSPGSLLCQRQGNSSCSSTLSPNFRRVTATPQDDPLLWDDLPFSESLNEFLDRIENARSTVSTKEPNPCSCSPAEGNNPLYGCFNQPSHGQDIVIADVQRGGAAKKLLQSAKHVDVSKERVLSCHQSKLTLVSGKEESRDETFGSLDSEVSPNPHQLAVSFPVRNKPPLSEEGFLQPEEAALRDISISENFYSCTDLKLTHNQVENPYFQTRVKPTHINCQLNDQLGDWENKENSSYWLNQSIDLKSNQEPGCDSAAPYKAYNVCKRELNPLSELQENRVVSSSILPWNYSGCPQGSYNASADLFESRAEEMEIGEEMLHEVQGSSAQRTASTTKDTVSELGLSPLDARCSYLKSKLSLHTSPTILGQKTSTPMAYSLSSSEPSLANTQNFVPYSQSTPVARCVYKARPLGERESILPKSPPSNYSKINFKCKRPRPSARNTLAKQLISKFLKCKRSGDTSCGDLSTSASQQSFVGALSENDTGEWIPPSATKLLHPRALSKVQTSEAETRNPARDAATWQSIKKSPISGQVTCGQPRTDTSLVSTESGPKTEQSARAGVRTVPFHGKTATTWLWKEPSLETCSRSSITHCLSWTSNSAGEPVNSASWSPELFADKSHFQMQGASFKSPPPNHESPLSHFL